MCFRISRKFSNIFGSRKMAIGVKGAVRFRVKINREKMNKWQEERRMRKEHPQVVKKSKI